MQGMVPQFSFDSLAIPNIMGYKTQHLAMIVEHPTDTDFNIHHRSIRVAITLFVDGMVSTLAESLKVSVEMIKILGRDLVQRQGV